MKIIQDTILAKRNQNIKLKTIPNKQYLCGFTFFNDVLEETIQCDIYYNTFLFQCISKIS